MTPKNQSQLKAILNKLQVNSLARKTNFTCRKVRKVSINNFLLGFFQMMSTGHFCLRSWALNVSILSKSCVSFQAIAKKLDFRQEAFFQELFQKSLLYRIEQCSSFHVNKMIGLFNRVIVEDSTCFKLPAKLFEFFPGAKLPHGRKSGGRLQLKIDVASNTYESIAIQSYCQNDASFAGNALGMLQKGDLLIRDLGYWSIPVFKEIIKKCAYFISRFKLSTSIYNADSQEKIELMEVLKECDRKGISTVDMTVLIGQVEKLKVRLIAIKSSPEQTQKRRKAAKKQRHKKTIITPKSYYLMSWSLLITNIKADQLQPTSLLTAYGLRWHIEMIFKTWKSNFNFMSIFKNCNGRNPMKPKILLLLALIWLLIFYVQPLNHFTKKVWESKNRILSPMRFANYLQDHEELLYMKDPTRAIELLAYYSCYDRRKDRTNHFEKIYMNILS